MALERRARLFGALLEHLPHDVTDTYEAIKTEIKDALTQMMESQAERISVTGLPSLVSELAEKLDVVLDSRVFGGNCGYAGESPERMSYRHMRSHLCSESYAWQEQFCSEQGRRYSRSSRVLSNRPAR